MVKATDGIDDVGTLATDAAPQQTADVPGGPFAGAWRITMAVHRIRDVPDDPLAAVTTLGPSIAAAALSTERERRVSTALLTSLRDAGVFRMGLPREVGGSATDLPTMLAVFEEVARHDGSAGWVAGIGAGTNFVLTALPPTVVHEVFAADSDTISGGTWMTRGRAVRVEGGYRVSGRWPFGSGCQHCGWLIGGCVVLDEGGPLLDDRERPPVRVTLFRGEDVVIHDTWTVSGLRGTGSHDYEVKDLFVPDEHSFRMADARGAFAFAHARMPLMGMLAAMLAAVLLGMARGALDTLAQQVRGHRAGGAPVKDRPLIQVRVAEAEALVRSARAFVFGTSERVWAKAVAGETIPLEDDVLLRLASSHAARACCEAAHLAFTAGGTAALYHDNPLQRFHRDILAGQQHGMVAFYSYEALGRDLLNEDPPSA